MTKEEFDSVLWTPQTRIKLNKGINGGFSEKILAIDFQLRRVRTYWRQSRWRFLPFWKWNTKHVAHWYNYTEIKEVNNGQSNFISKSVKTISRQVLKRSSIQQGGGGLL